MDSVGIAGDDTPGILALGWIKDPDVLLGKADHFLADSLTAYLTGGKKPSMPARGGDGRFRPKIHFRSDVLDPEKKYVVAVIPFFNLGDRKYADRIIALHFVKELRRLENVDVVEPGVVIQKLLESRVVMDDGLSLAQADLLFEFLGADLLLTGKVLDYQDVRGSGVPKVDFSALLLERSSREVVWTSKNYSSGDDGVFFFDWGRVNTAGAMASRMVKTIVEEMIPR
jgi:hypothetical protein